MFAKMEESLKGILGALSLRPNTGSKDTISRSSLRDRLALRSQCLVALLNDNLGRADVRTG